MVKVGLAAGALVVLGILGAIVVGGLALVHRSAGSLETAYGNGMVSLVSRFEARDVGANPIQSSPQVLEAARGAYTGSCSQCHGASGDGRGAFGAAGFPPA